MHVIKLLSSLSLRVYVEIVKSRLPELRKTLLRLRKCHPPNALRRQTGDGRRGTDGTFSVILFGMARLARIVAVNIAHRVTQRGNARQFILAADSERLVYLQLLQHYVELHELSLLGYCLMSNHVHLVIVPRKVESLALALKQTHGRYASYWNAAHRSSGHVWQGRFYSCPLDEDHLWIALRYAELNP
jgi:REP element-mobilizing transposase RayT